MFVNFAIYNTEHNPSESYKMYCSKWHFSIAMELKNATEIECHGFRN